MLWGFGEQLNRAEGREVWAPGETNLGWWEIFAADEGPRGVAATIELKPLLSEVWVGGDEGVDAYGVGARVERSRFPRSVLRRPRKLTAAPGDLFLFNSEFFHDTPTIVGQSARTVFNSFAGWSKHGNTIELYA